MNTIKQFSDIAYIIGRDNISDWKKAEIVIAILNNQSDDPQTESIKEFIQTLFKNVRKFEFDNFGSLEFYGETKNEILFQYNKNHKEVYVSYNAVYSILTNKYNLTRDASLNILKNEIMRLFEIKIHLISTMLFMPHPQYQNALDFLHSSFKRLNVYFSKNYPDWKFYGKSKEDLIYNYNIKTKNLHVSIDKIDTVLKNKFDIDSVDLKKIVHKAAAALKVEISDIDLASFIIKFEDVENQAQHPTLDVTE